ncbi:MAPEG family protein [Jannaschia sp. W003]|uniref:MAPEG family protein n=1 Tax=Jannaschia sp. W003 TaxID=2867012 RepID=UPI0021A307B8|nr:MAPEG family protein [Jannaschia sp. W003]UWQ21702.1 MAPEG family protein [Jannaschia sp. W003]
MTPELLALALAVLLHAAQFALYAIPANREVGMGYTMSARDRPPSRQLSQRTERMGRAFDNHAASLALFTAAVAVVTLSGEATAFTAVLAFVHLGARILYVPAYAMGLRPGRSLLWMVGFTATLLMVISALI